MLLFYIRHGDPIYNPNQLTSLGHRQAEAVAKRLYLHGIDKIYSSDSNRAVQTAQPTCELIKKEMILLPWCNESVAWKHFTGMHEELGRDRWYFEIPKYRLLLNSPEVRGLGDEWYRHPAFEKSLAETGVKLYEKEVDAFLSSLGYDHDPETGTYTANRPNDDRIALFAHEGVGKIFMSCLLDIPYPLYATHFEMGHSSMTVIEFPNTDKPFVPRMLQLSNDSHLYKEGLSTHYQNEIRF